ncbi:MAG TPA: Flp pilus assembly protein CpaB [Myxococcales bacterium]|nr:Flp pilus assembly protein CpaB [Myxococcales bacterium]
MSNLSDRLTQNSRKPAGTQARSSGVRAGVFLGLALLAALGAGLLFRNYLERSPLGRAMPTEKVVVAAMDLPLATTLRAEQLTTIDWPKASLPQGTAGDPAGLVGKVLLAGVVKGEPVLAAKLASEKAGQGLAAVLPEEMRAVAVRVDDVVGVAGFIHPGDAVDVIVTMKASESSHVPPTAKVILQNVRVLAVGKELDHKSKKQKAVPVTVATLMVSSPDSEKLALASTKGKILLALRNRVDATEVETPGIIPAVLLEGGASEPAEEKPQDPAKSRPRRAVARKPAAVKPQTGEHQVEILRGDRFETRQFSSPEPKP